MQEKTCTTCGESKTLDEFYKNPKGKLGYDSQCILCKKNYYQKTQNRRIEYSSKYKNEHRNNINEYARQYYYNNSTKMKLYHSQYRQDHPKYFRDKGREYHKRKLESNPSYVIECRLRSRIKNTIKKGYKNTKSMELLGCTIDEFKIHLQKTAITNGYLTFDIDTYSGKEYHIDHIIPCVSFDLTDPEQQKQCFHYSNQQILTASENLSKHDKVEE